MLATMTGMRMRSMRRAEREDGGCDILSGSIVQMGGKGKAKEDWWGWDEEMAEEGQMSRARARA